jgi:diguanylate cyclase (GGDEF)-like protein/PAS domain S-box-containing protein
MRWTLGVKLTLGIAIIMTVTMGSALLLLNMLTRDRMMDDYSQFALHLSDMAVAGLENSMVSRNQEEMENIMQTISRGDEIEGGVIFDNRGEIKYSTDPKDLGRILAKSDPGCRPCHDITTIKDQPQTIILSSKEGAHMLRVARPVYNQPRCQRCHQEKMLGMLMIDFSLGKIDRKIGAVISKQFYSILMVAVIIISALIGFVYLMVTRPMEHFVRIIRAIDSGDSSRRVNMTRQDEIGKLAASFDNMVEGMATRTQELERLNEIAATQITERKRAEKVLQEREEKYSNLFNNAAVGMFRTRLDGSEMLDMNEKFLEIFGLTREEMHGTASVMHWADPQEREEMVRRLKAEERVIDFECRMLNKRNEERNCLTSVRVYHEQGILEGSIVDITDRKRAEVALRKSEALHRHIVETSLEGIWIINEELRTTFVNQRIVDMLGYAPEEILGKQVESFMFEEDLEEYASKIDARRRGEGGYIERRFRHKDGTALWVIVSSTALFDDENRFAGRFAMFTDITARKKAEEEILALSINDQLTGLHNRRGFLSLAGQQLKLAERNKSGMLLFFADLDGLKWINDTLGHEEGDKALIEAAAVLQETFRTSDIIARLGGDEYAALAVDITEAGSEIFTARLQFLIDTRNKQENRRYTLSISVGCSYYDPENPCSIDELMASADKLMYEQKQKKKGLLL